MAKPVRRPQAQKVRQNKVVKSRRGNGSGGVERRVLGTVKRTERAVRTIRKIETSFYGDRNNTTTPEA